MKLDWKHCPVSHSDYEETGLTDIGIEKARVLEDSVRELLTATAEANPNASPHDVVDFLVKCLHGVGYSKDIMKKWNAQIGHE